jgi:hypothetical protein
MHHTCAGHTKPHLQVVAKGAHDLLDLLRQLARGRQHQRLRGVRACVHACMCGSGTSASVSVRYNVCTRSRAGARDAGGARHAAARSAARSPVRSTVLLRLRAALPPAAATCVSAVLLLFPSRRLLVRPRPPGELPAVPLRARARPHTHTQQCSGHSDAT